MEWYEIAAAMKYSYYSAMEQWEIGRLVAYMIAQSNSKRRLTLQDIIKFPWEKEEEGDTAISKEDIERLKANAEKYLKNQNNNKEIR